MVRWTSTVTSPSARSQAILATLLLLTSVPAYASLTFNPTFASSITDDTVHAAAIEANINAVLAVYSLDFSNNVTVPITFGEMTTGLGESSFFFDQVSYHTFC